MAKKHDKMGRDGLEVLMTTLAEQAQSDARETNRGEWRSIPVEAVEIGRVNTRRQWDGIEELAKNIDEIGLLQPIRVARTEADRYVLIAGERRLRAVQQLGWTHIPAIVARAEDVGAWTVEMVSENIQRKDLTPWEEAAAYSQLIEAGMTLEDVARYIGRSKGYVSVLMKLAKQPAIRQAWETGIIPNISVARALNPLIQDNGTERVPGLLAKALAYYQTTKPTVAQLESWVNRQLTEQEQRQAALRSRPTWHQMNRTLTRWEKIVAEERNVWTAEERQQIRMRLEKLLATLEEGEAQA